MNVQNENINTYDSLENLLKAIDIIAGSKLNNIPCDRTEICIVQGKKNDAINTNTYIVSNGSLQFEAVVDAALGSSDAPKYKKNDSVRVLIPNGNYQETKYITGLHVADINNPTAYITPQDSILNITGNLFTENKTYSLAANNKEESEIFIGEVDLIQNDMYRNNYQAYDTLILSANFRTLFSSSSGISNVINGSYGLRLELYQEIVGDSGIVERLLEHSILLDSSDMIGNPYLFQIDSIQSIKFAIPNPDKKLAGGKLYFYQKNNFNYLTNSGMTNSVPLIYAGTTLVKNLFASNINLSFGAELSKIEGKQFKIFTNESLNFSNKNEERQKNFSSLWYNKDTNNKYIGFSDGVYDVDYDELTYRKQIAEEQKLQSQLFNATIDTSTDIRGITLSAHYSDIASIYNEIYQQIDVYMWNTLQSFLTAVKGINNTDINSITIEGSFINQIENIKSTYLALSNFYKQTLSYAKNWQIAQTNGEERPEIPIINNRKTVLDLIETIEVFSNYVTMFNKYEQIIDEYIYSRYISQITGYYKKIENYCLELEKFESEDSDFKDSQELNFYLDNKQSNYNFNENLYKKDEEWHKNYANKYCIYWYRYNPNYENTSNEEMLMGAGWERITKAANGNSLINFGIPKENNESGYNNVYNDNNTFILQMDLDKTSEKIAAVLFYNHEMYKSNILDFTNLTPSSSAINLDGINALSIIHGDNSKSVYQCYGVDNQITRSSEISTTRYLKLQYNGTKGGNEVLLGAKVLWYLPKNSTMLTYNEKDNKEQINGEEQDILILDSNSSNSDYIFSCDEITSEKNASFPYHIKNSYFSSFSNNSIKCKVILSDGEQLETEMFFTFATGEANGTGYAFVVAPTTNVTHVSSISNGEGEIDEDKIVPLQLSINIYKGDGTLVNIDNVDNTITAEWLCCKYVEEGDSVEEKYYKLTFNKDSNGYISGCTIRPKRAWGGPGIIKFIANIQKENEDTESQRLQQKLTTYYTVPWCPSGISYYMDGATTVTYNTLGTNPTNYTGIYRLFYNQNVYDENNNIIHYKDEEVKNVQWKMRYYIFDNKTYESEFNTHNQSFVDIKDNKNYYEIDNNRVAISSKYRLLMNYLPKIEQQTLKPSNMYLDGLLETGEKYNSLNDSAEADIRQGNMYPAVLAYTKDSADSLDNVLWIQPIILMQNAYGSSALNNWDGSLAIDEGNNTIFSSIIGAGRKLNLKNAPNTFEGVLMGDVGKTDSSASLGLYGYHQGVQSFGFKTDGTAFIGKSSTGRIEFNGTKATIKSKSTNGLIIDLDDAFLTCGTSIGLYANDLSSSKKIGPSELKKDWRLIAGANFGVDSNGVVYTGNIKASGGTIGGWTIFDGQDGGKPSQFIGSTNTQGSMYLTTINDNSEYWIRTMVTGTITFSIDRKGYIYSECISLYDNNDSQKNNKFVFNSNNAFSGDRFYVYTNLHTEPGNRSYTGMYIGSKGISFYGNGIESDLRKTLFEWNREKSELVLPTGSQIWIYDGQGGNTYYTLYNYIKAVINGTAKE